MIKTVSNKENYVTEQQSLKYLLSGPLMSKFSGPPDPAYLIKMQIPQFHHWFTES